MRIVLKKQPVKIVNRLRRKFFHTEVRKKFLIWLAENGYLEGYENYISLEKALEGRASNRVVVHHVLPLKAGGDNDFSNLILVDNKLHRRLHRYIYDPVLREMPEDATLELEIPDLRKVSVWAELGSEVPVYYVKKGDLKAKLELLEREFVKV